MALESGDGRLRREGARKSWLVLLVQNSSSLFSMAYNAVHVSILRLWGKRLCNRVASSCFDIHTSRKRAAP
jgi:hypothetical protein